MEPNSNTTDHGESVAIDQIPTGEAPVEAPTGEAVQFITFTIGDEEYAVDIMAVREIKGWTEITRLPNTPDYMRGVLNLRGVIVPIFDLRSRFGQGTTEASNLHVVIVVSVDERIMGVLVDAVSDILSTHSEEIRPVPETDGSNHQDFLKGLVTAGERMVAILALERLFASDVIDIKDTAQAAPAA